MIRFPPQKILVPFDFTEAAQEAWTFAKGLSPRLGAELQALYVDQPPVPAGWEMAPLLVPPEPRRKLRARLRKALGEKTRLRVEPGEPASEIVKTAARFDLVVMGTHGRTGLDRFLLGSVAEAVVRRSRTPVLTVRGPAGPVKSILAPVNFTAYSRFGFGYAAAVAADLGAQLTMLHVAEPGAGGNPEATMKLMIDGLPPVVRGRCRPMIEITEGSAPETIERAASAHDLVVLVAHTKSLLKDAVLGTTAERILRLSTAPVLSLPEPRELFRFQRWSLPEGGWRRQTPAAR